VAKADRRFVLAAGMVGIKWSDVPIGFIADERQKGLVCQCEPCRKKRVRLDVDKPKKRLKHIAA